MQIEYDPMNIALGMIILLLISYTLISLYTFLYIKYAKKIKFERGKFFFAVSVVSLAWLVSTIFATMFYSNYGLLVFGGVSMTIIFGLNFFIVEKFLGISGKHKIFYCLALAVIMNPTWFSVLGII